MKQHQMPHTVGRRSLIAAATGGTFLTTLNAPAAFAAGTSPTTVTRFGKAIQFGNGTVQMYAKVRMGRTRSLGLLLSNGVLQGLPDHNVPGGDAQAIVPMVPGLYDAAIKHATIGYNAHGHEPIMFEVPHFDFHFYFMTQAERMTIDPSRGAAYQEEANRPAPAGVMPQDFMAPPLPPGVPWSAATIPFMGLHWFDMFKSAAIPGNVFNHEFINGSWNGTWTFLEPMITRDWLELRTSYSEVVKQPQTYSYPGSYPTQLNLFHSSSLGGWVIALREFE